MLQEFVQQVKTVVSDMINEVHTAMPGTINSFDPGTGLASVTPAGKFRTPDGKQLDYPAITGVPVVIPQSSTVQIAFPISPGDSCLLIMSEQELDSWLYGREEADGKLKFDLTSAIAIPGLLNRGSAALAEACNTGSAVIAAGASKMSVSANGVTITGNVIITGNLSASGNISCGGSFPCNA
ncbi:Gp138 family membrane-puncturing spike protein [Lacrimispora sp.]|uniref:Gp138 family membrane-puncturing spike protein n=1 Tax=Lacrimispora sp. TaxID=2719234 RepID=UPI0028ADC585|nr:Gp138 family membrane-puncturing spike protein [Lacrimispora sp.]